MQHDFLTSPSTPSLCLDSGLERVANEEDRLMTDTTEPPVVSDPAGYGWPNPHVSHATEPPVVPDPAGYGWTNPYTSLPIVAPVNQNSVVSNDVRKGAKSMWKRSPAYPCGICGIDFTSAHNHQYDPTSHSDLQPYTCEYKAYGCIYSATTARTAARHSSTCRYRPL